jgi:phospholipid-binding lipoprotein MlaA
MVLLVRLTAIWFVLLLIVPVYASEPLPGNRQNDTQIGLRKSVVASSGNCPETVLITQGNDSYPDDLYEDDLYEDELYEDERQYQIADPIYPFNKAMFHVNDKLYFWILKPAAQGWRAVVPEMARTGIKNFFYNLTTPVRLINAVFQAKLNKAEAEFARFLVNTSIGILGFGNPAQNYDELKVDPEDCGQTLGVYGVGHGFYIVWPVFGPSSFRDTFGLVGDHFMDPVSYVNPWEASIAASVTDKVNATSFRIGDYESFKEAALLPYEAMRNAYVQNRDRKLVQ